MSLAEWLLEMSALLAGAVLLGMLARRLRLPLTVVLAVAAFLVGWIGRPFGLESPLEGETFEQVVVFLFLPVLVFQAALGLSVRAFFRNLGPIMALAIVALLVSAALVGYAVNLVLGIPLSVALLFGALIAATDPVAVVAVFRELGVPRRLLTLVEGESLLNDGVAIVMANILIAVALGGEASVAGGVVDFIGVFFGGAAIGIVLGLAAAAALPWLERLPAAALSLALAYGSFILADEVLGFSGVMATVGAGLVLAGLAPSRASAEVRALWEELWEGLDYIANLLVFLLIGLAVDPELLGDNIGAIALAIVVVIVARAVAVVPLVSLLERFARIPPVGRRNEAVLIWGGLRGGVALALALALPEELPARDTLVAMTGGVVLATLLVNATTISALVHRLGLNRPSRGDRFLAGTARLSGLRAARERLDDLGLADPEIDARLDAIERSAHEELTRIDLSEEEKLTVVIGRGLGVERETYQHLSDAGLLPPTTTRVLLHEVDDQIEEVGAGTATLETLRHRQPPRLERLARRVTGWLPEPAGEDPTHLAYAEASARRLAARRTNQALEVFKQLPNVGPATVDHAERMFSGAEQEAIATLEELDRQAGSDAIALHHHQADALSRAAADDALRDLSETGLLPARVAQDAARVVADEISGPGARP